MADFIPLKKWPGGIGEAESGDKILAEFLPVAALAIAFGALVCTASGTANAQVLTPVYSAAAPAAYVDGAEYSTKFATTNTGATTINIAGLGAKTAVTVTGAALPAGYLRTDVRTRLWYDQVADKLVVDRQPEYGSNSNGEFWRYADSRLECKWRDSTVRATDTAAGTLYAVETAITWTFPAPFAVGSAPSVTPSFERVTGAISHFGGLSDAPSATAARLKGYSGASGATGRLQASAAGSWY